MHRSFVRMGSAGIALAALIAFMHGTAQAAPQALALVATKGKVGLACEGRECSAELTTFCLQADRFSPAGGTRYQLAHAGEVRLIGTTGDGRKVALDPDASLRIESIRSHVAVRVSALRDELDALGLKEIEIAVGEDVALLPAPELDDANPITESEIVVLTGPLRTLGTRIVDSNGARMQAARLTTRMINLLPPGGETGEVGRPGLWRRAIAETGEGGLTAGAKDLARGGFEFCRFAVEIAGSSSLRRCLQTQHDGFINFLNAEYWEAVKTGS